MKIIKDYNLVSSKIFENSIDSVYNRKARVKRSITRLIENVAQENKKARCMLKDYYKIYLADVKDQPKIRRTNLIILPFMIGKVIKIYDGKTYVSVMFHDESLGRYIGEFIDTRKQGVHVATKKKNKK